MVGALIAWLVTCAAHVGDINVDNLGTDYPMLAGNVTALGLSCIVTSVLSYAMPQNFDWDVMRQGIHMIEVDGTDKLAAEGEDSEEGLHSALKCAFHSHPCSRLSASAVRRSVCLSPDPEGPRLLTRAPLACRFTYRWGTALTILLVVIWPVLALPATVFSKGYFTFWTIIAIVWGILASAAMIFLPVAESSGAIVTTAKNIASGNRTQRHEFAQEVEMSKHGGGTQSTEPSKNGGALPAKEDPAIHQPNYKANVSDAV